MQAKNPKPGINRLQLKIKVNSMITNIILSTFITFIILFSSCGKEEWQPLFDGKSLEGWTASENPASFWVEDGYIVCEGPRAHLFHNGNFKNFELKADVKTFNGANSGIYFHTAFQDQGWPEVGYEIQVLNAIQTPPNRTTGSLSEVQNIYELLVKDNEWFNLHIAVRGKRIVVHVDDQKVIDYIEPENPPRDASHAKRVLSEGTFALQCHDTESRVYFKNISVKRLPDNL
jgi:hypothetical protein